MRERRLKIKSNDLMKFALRNGMEILFVNFKNKENWGKQDFAFIMDGMAEKSRKQSFGKHGSGI